MTVKSDRQFSGSRLRKVRGKQSLREFALIVGVSHETVRAWETQRLLPNSDDLALLSRLSGKPIDFFFVRRGRAA